MKLSNDRRPIAAFLITEKFLEVCIVHIGNMKGKWNDSLLFLSMGNVIENQKMLTGIFTLVQCCQES